LDKAKAESSEHGKSSPGKSGGYKVPFLNSCKLAIQVLCIRSHPNTDRVFGARTIDFPQVCLPIPKEVFIWSFKKNLGSRLGASPDLEQVWALTDVKSMDCEVAIAAKQFL
jgi:hypothetical protein